MASVYDGFVSRHLNRRVSRPVARALSHTPVTPNQVSLFSLVVAIGGLVSFINGYPILGGVLAQASSIIDGVDGDLARLTGKSSSFGAFFDAILDRYTDGIILLGLILWTVGDTSSTLVWVIGFAALAGTYTVTYTRARIDEAHRVMFDRGLTSLASRDVRILIVLIGSVVGQGLGTLLLLAVLTNTMVLARLVSARASLRVDGKG
jgi:phosphatidylglycerophosphate synthase